MMLIKYLVSLGLLCLSGLFSGLTLGLMSLDNVGLQIIIDGGDEEEAKLARKIKPLRDQGNLLLCTLLLGNTVVNSSLSILLSDIFVGPIAILASTFLIVIFGEICPQALCSRHGLKIGAMSLPVVNFFLIMMYPISYPISLVLDHVLGREIGNVYSRNELKALVAIHVEDPDAAAESGLTSNDHKFLHGALAYKEKVVSEVFTKFADVFTLNTDDRLDFPTLLSIYKSGFTRIPVVKEGTTDVHGILYTKDLILVDPDDELEVSTILAFHGNKVEWVPVSMPLDLVFQHFNACNTHMLCVCPDPPEDFKDFDVQEWTLSNGESNKKLSKTSSVTEFMKKQKAYSMRESVNRLKAEGKAVDDLSAVTEEDMKVELIGVITMEDVLEELLQQEIVDESDNFEDVKTRTKRVNKDRRQGVTKFLELFEEKMREEVELSKEEVNAICAYLVANVKEFRSMDNAPETLKRLVARASVIDDEMDAEMARNGKATIDDVKLRTDSDMSGGSGEDDDPIDSAQKTRRRVLYKHGVPTTKFTLILQGKVEMEVGDDNIETELGPWSVIAQRAISQNPAESSIADVKPYKPDFTAVAIAPYRLVQIDRVDFLAALHAVRGGSAFTSRLGSRISSNSGRMGTGRSRSETAPDPAEARAVRSRSSDGAA